MNNTGMNSPGYTVGDSDFSRGWGGYVVTAVGINNAGEEFCEKDITVRPGQALSLQSHDHRRELWRVVSGSLTVVLDGARHTMQPGEEISIPLGAIHCMANLSQSDCIVHEVQEGLCREDDIHRFRDMYGRPAERSDADAVLRSLELYNKILGEIAAGAPQSHPGI